MTNRVASSTPQEIRSITYLNNEAVQVLIAGDDHQALRLLRESLVLMKGFVDPRPLFHNKSASISSSSSSLSITTRATLFGMSPSCVSIPFFHPEAAATSFGVALSAQQATAMAEGYGPTATAPEWNPNFTSLSSSASADLQQEQQRCCDGRCSSHLPSTLKLTDLEEDAAESSHTFIYSKPFLFPDELLSSGDLGCFLHIHCAVVIFNMALAHHHMAKTTKHSHRHVVHTNNNAGNTGGGGCCCPSTLALLDKTIALYDMCLELLENCDPALGNARLVELAALNNVSQLRFEVGDHITARKGLDVLAVLMFGSNFCPWMLSHFQDEDVRGFLLNIVLLQPSTVALAA